MKRPDLFKLRDRPGARSSKTDNGAVVHAALRAAQLDRLYEPLFTERP